MPPLHVAFLWHMHQPQYRNFLTGYCAMPWVRLHATKGYSDIASIAERYPQARQNVNLVPCLLSQLEEAVAGARDEVLDLTEIPADSLSKEQAAAILRAFFMADWDRMIDPHPRYRQLLELRGRSVSDDAIEAALARFRTGDLRDLQVWFNLAWMGFDARERKAVVRELLEKGGGFSEDDKAALLEVQREVVAEVIPRYRQLQEAGVVELTFTPYFHPILPLVCDTESAREAMPNVPLPRRRFRRPEDAALHVRMGIEKYREVFGGRPKGMWPAEGAVSEEILPILEEAGVEWLASDQGVLERSDTDDAGGTAHHFAYTVGPSGRLAMIFRDRGLSDLIGFSYGRMDPAAAVDDMIGRLRDISRATEQPDAIVSVILDGENPWEYYDDGGRGFLSGLFGGLAADEELIPCRVSDFLAEHPPARRVKRLFAGSWIGADFRVWIGSREDNEAWDMLGRTRDMLESARGRGLPEDKLELAMRAVLAAEGSDWFWWFGDTYSSGNDELFDATFRAHLAAAYEALGEKVPEFLLSPIIREAVPAASLEPLALIQPVLDGRSTHYYEWVSAGRFETARAGGVMQTSDVILEALYFGFDLKTLYLRVDTHRRPADLAGEGVRGCLVLLGTDEVELEVPLSGGVLSIRRRDPEGRWVTEHTGGKAVSDRVVEAAVEFGELGIGPGEDVRFIWVFRRDDVELERWPRGGYLWFIAPTPDYEMEHWHV